MWIRGFPGMEQRRVALAAFYGGPVWKTHSRAANATMVDVDDVLLLRPLPKTAGFDPLPERPAPGTRVPGSLVVATVCSLHRPADPVVVRDELIPALAEAGAPPLAAFVEEPSENTFPALPVRTGEHVLVLIQRAPTPSSVAGDLARELLPDLVADPVHVRLEPTPRSMLR